MEAAGLENYQGNNWGVNISVFLYLSLSNGLFRWVSERKTGKDLNLGVLTKIFYVLGIISNIYFLRILKVCKTEDTLLNAGMCGFYVQSFGMLETILLILSKKMQNVDPIHVMDYCVIVTFSTIFAYGNSELIISHTFVIYSDFFLVPLKYGTLILTCHSMNKILEYTYNLIYGPQEFDLLRSLVYKLKVMINFAVLHQLIFHELGWNIVTMIYYAPAIGHLWFEIKKYYGLSSNYF